MEYKIVKANSPEKLNAKVEKLIKEGFVAIGSHSVVTTHIQNRFRGNQHVDSLYENEYSQTLNK